jgi:hypothetical protein
MPATTSIWNGTTEKANALTLHFLISNWWKTWHLATGTRSAPLSSAGSNNNLFGNKELQKGTPRKDLCCERWKKIIIKIKKIKQLNSCVTVLEVNSPILIQALTCYTPYFMYYFLFVVFIFLLYWTWCFFISV